MRKLLPLAVVAAALTPACVGDAPTPGAAGGPSLAVAIAALSLDGVHDACYRLTVRNGAETPATVAEVTLSSGRYGDGGGSASYVVTCDASEGVALNTVTLEVLGIYADANVDCESPPEPLEFRDPGPLVRSQTCSPNADARVDFDIALMRPASQGFFDVAVNFGEIFCSAKLDCCAPDGEGGCADRDILFDGGGDRGPTVVMGFACAAAASGATGVDTRLYLDDVVITCDGDQGTRTVVSPDGDGNLCDPTSNQCDAVTDPLDLLFQAQVSRGAEAVSGLDKVYWNLALGVKKASMAGKACTLTATATADDHAQDGLDGTFRGAQAGEIEAGAVYPTVTWSVPLSTVGGGAFACTQHGLGSDEVTTAYTATTALEPRDLKWCYDPDGPCCAVDGPQCGLAACDADTGECVGCKAKTTTDFESGLGNWIIYDAPGVADAVLVSGAAPQNHYIRLTADTGGAGNYQRGQIYNTTDVIDAGGVSVRFDFRASNVAGNAPNPADGLALTIVKATPAQLTGDILPNAGFGGGLGYHYPGHGYEAVTVEIDLLENQTNGFDPAGSGMHIAVTRNLDASSHLAWVNVPNLSANVWRTVEVRLVGTVVQIWLGGALLTEAQTSVDFSGGLMFFSAGTGEWWAEHDVDNVLVDHGCSDAPVVYTGNRALFVTSGTYVPGAGDFTGVSGADAICQQVADAAPLLQAVRPNARWRAWLSTSGVNAALHVGATDGPFVTFYGSASAPQQALIGTSLTSYSFQGFPATYEDGAGTGPTEVWTGTNGDGSFAGAAASCSDFTSASSGISGRYGKPNYVTSNWTSYGDQTCNVASHLYCVQMRD